MKSRSSRRRIPVNRRTHAPKTQLDVGYGGIILPQRRLRQPKRLFQKAHGQSRILQCHDTSGRAPCTAAQHNGWTLPTA